MPLLNTGQFVVDTSGNLVGLNAFGAVVIKADAALDAIFIYADTGSSTQGSLLTAWAGRSGSDDIDSTGYAQGINILQGGLTLYNQASDPPAVANASTFFSSPAGRPVYLSQSGDRSIIDRSVVNAATFNVPNTTAPTIISASTTYQASEGQQSSEYEIEVWGGGLWGTSFLNGTVWQLYVDGSPIGNSFTTGTSGQALGQGFGYCVTYGLTIQTTGAGGTALVWSKGNFWRNDPANTDIPGNSINAGSLFSGAAFDTTSSHTLLIKANWSATAGGQTFTTYRTRITRRE